MVHLDILQRQRKSSSFSDFQFIELNFQWRDILACGKRCIIYALKFNPKLRKSNWNENQFLNNHTRMVLRHTYFSVRPAPTTCGNDSEHTCITHIYYILIESYISPCCCYPVVHMVQHIHVRYTTLQNVLFKGSTLQVADILTFQCAALSCVPSAS